MKEIIPTEPTDGLDRYEVQVKTAKDTYKLGSLATECREPRYVFRALAANLRMVADELDRRAFMAGLENEE